jgi:hypothetical protein
MIRAKPGPNQWTWTVYLPDGKTKEGSMTGARSQAEVAATYAIDTWLRATKPKDGT